jgi:hypothetical protein
MTPCCIVRFTPIALLALALSACSANPASPTQPSPSAAATQVATPQKWSGSTSQSRTVTFVVSGTEVVNFKFSAVGAFDCASIAGGLDFIEGGGQATISDGVFSFSGNPGGQVTFTVDGIFSSATAAAGAITVKHALATPGACPSIAYSVTWRAQRE